VKISRKRWPPDVVAKVKRDWADGHPAKEIARRLYADGLLADGGCLITGQQVQHIITHYSLPGPRNQPRHSDDLIAQVRHLWEHGWSHGHIAAALVLKRNTVIAMKRRHHFERRTDNHFTMLNTPRCAIS
jgi:hypothetical protein